MLYDLLDQLGFSKKEADVYVCILQHGKIAAVDIAKLTGINSTTVYSVAKELLNKKVIREDLASSKGYFLARPPEDLHGIIEKEKLQLNKREHAINKAIGELSTIAKSASYAVPKIVFVDEDELDKFCYDQSKKWSDSVGQFDGVWWGFQDHTFVEHYEKWIQWFWRQPFTANDSLRMYSNESQIEEKMKSSKITRRQIRFWKGETPISSTLWILGDYIVMIVTRTRPFYAVEIKDAMLAANLRSVFGELWGKA